MGVKINLRIKTMKYIAYSGVGFLQKRFKAHEDSRIPSDSVGVIRVPKIASN